MVRNHPEVLHYGEFQVQRPPSIRTQPDMPKYDAEGRLIFDLDSVFESGQSGWFVLSDKEWVKYQAIHKDRFKHAMVAPMTRKELDGPMIVYFEGSKP